MTRVKIGDRVIASVGNGGMQEEVLADPNRCIPMPDGMDFETGVRPHPHLRYLALRAEGSRQAEGRRNSRRARRGGRRRPGGRRTRQGDGRTRDRGRIERRKRSTSRRSTARMTASSMRQASFRAISRRNSPNRSRSATGGKGADVLYDPVGGDYAEPAVRAMNWEGRYLVHRLHGGHSERSAQSDPAQELRHPGRVLGRVHRAQSQAQPGTSAPRSCVGQWRARSSRSFPRAFLSRAPGKQSACWPTARHRAKSS